MPQVYIKFPKTGLGNMLLVWARGIVFARLNDLPYTTSAWWGLHWGALLRRENKKRVYLGYFNETPLWKRWRMELYCKLNNVERNPVIKKTEAWEQRTVYLFNKVTTTPNLFGDIRGYEAVIKEALKKSLTSKLKSKLSGYEVPFIGLHIRRGDFKLGNQTTALEYFIKGVNVIRSATGKSLPVTIFTDAGKQELTGLMALPHISFAESKPDILDILLLSQSKIMLLSSSSTFGYWAAFLSDAIVIRPINDWQQLIKNTSNDSRYKEIKWDYQDEESTQELAKKLLSEATLC